VGAGYFETLGVPLLQGRLFDSRDGPDAAPTAIINESMARRFWPDRIRSVRASRSATRRTRSPGSR
jgi:hypothetical protein